MRDSLYEDIRFRLSEMPHHYGQNVHLLTDPFLLSQLAVLCASSSVVSMNIPPSEMSLAVAVTRRSEPLATSSIDRLSGTRG